MAWKTADAATLEAELVAVAVEMEASMLAKLGAAGGSPPRPRSAHDLQVPLILFRSSIKISEPHLCQMHEFIFVLP